MRIVCQQTILMKYHILFFFWKLGNMSQSLSSAAGLECRYSEYYKIRTIFLFLFSNEMLVLAVGIHKCLSE